MTERQRLIYDLSLLCTANELQRRKPSEITYLPADALDTFVAMVECFRQMDSAAVSRALESIQKA